MFLNYPWIWIMDLCNYLLKISFIPFKGFKLLHVSELWASEGQK